MLFAVMPRMDPRLVGSLALAVIVGAACAGADPVSSAADSASRRTPASDASTTLDAAQVPHVSAPYCYRAELPLLCGTGKPGDISRAIDQAKSKGDRAAATYCTSCGGSEVLFAESTGLAYNCVFDRHGAATGGYAGSDTASCSDTWAGPHAQRIGISKGAVRTRTRARVLMLGWLPMPSSCS